MKKVVRVKTEEKSLGKVGSVYPIQDGGFVDGFGNRRLLTEFLGEGDNRIEILEEVNG